MNWKEEATEKLRKYDAMRLAVQNLPEELKRVEQQSYVPTAPRSKGALTAGKICF